MKQLFLTLTLLVPLSTTTSEKSHNQNNNFLKFCVFATTTVITYQFWIINGYVRQIESLKSDNYVLTKKNRALEEKKSNLKRNITIETAKNKTLSEEISRLENKITSKNMTINYLGKIIYSQSDINNSKTHPLQQEIPAVPDELSSTDDMINRIKTFSNSKRNIHIDDDTQSNMATCGKIPCYRAAHKSVTKKAF